MMVTGWFARTAGEAWEGDAAQGGNAAPTPFGWGGARWAGRRRCRERCHRLGGSGACS
jgi:hypothetical protein